MVEFLLSHLCVPRDVESVGVGLGEVGEVLVQGDLK